MSKKSQNFQTSSKFHRLNRRKDGIFSCMRSARVDWGKSHRQINNFSRGLRFRAKICIFSTRNLTKITRFDFFRTFRATAPAATPQNCKSNAKYASGLGPSYSRRNYAERGPYQNFQRSRPKIGCRSIRPTQRTMHCTETDAQNR